MTAKVLVVALDAADYRLIQYFIHRGRLPNLRDLMGKGRTHRLASLSGLTDDALWASFQYGDGLGRHGRYHWQRESKNRKGYVYDTVGETDLTAWWEPLAEQGFKVAIFDIPKAKLTDLKGGLHLTDWLVHGRYGQDVKSSPPALADDVLNRFGNLENSYCRLAPEQADTIETKDIVESLLDSVARKTAAATHFLAQSDWDIFATSFKELHCLSHLRSIEPVLEGSDDTLSSPFQKICDAIDDALGRLRHLAGKDCVPIIFSTTGMTTNKSIEHLAPELANRIDRILKPKKGIAEYFGRKRQPAVEVLPYNEDSLALRIRAKSNRERRKRTESIEKLVMDLRDGNTGHKVFFHSHRLPTTHPGPRANRLPDVLITLTASAGQPSELKSDALGTIREQTTAIRPGNHSGNGFLITPPLVPAKENYAMEDIGALVTQTLKLRSNNP